MFTLFFNPDAPIVVRPDRQNTVPPRFPQAYPNKLNRLGRSAKAYDDVVTQRKKVPEQSEKQEIRRL